MEVYLDNSATTKCYESVREIVGKVMKITAIRLQCTKRE